MTTRPLSVQGLVKHYGALRAVNGVSFDLEPGELVGLIGPNGAGKSTTYRCIVGLNRPDTGRVLIDGIDVHLQRTDALRRLGYVGQDLEIYQYLTGEELLRLVGRIYELPTDVLETRLQQLVEMMGLGPAMSRLVHQYSGGMARKLAIATALLTRPPLLLLDESFNGLDPESTVAIRRHLDALRADGTAVLLSSHVLDMLERWVTRVLVMVDGELVDDLGRDQLDNMLGAEFETLTDLYLDRAQHRTR